MTTECPETPSSSGFKPRRTGPPRRIETASSVPIPVALTEAKPAPFDVANIERSLRRTLRMSDDGGAVDVEAVKKLTGLDILEIEMPDLDMRSYLCLRALIYFAGDDIKPSPTASFSAPAAELRRFMEHESAHESSVRLKQTLMRLLGSAVTIEYRDRKRRRRRVEHLLSHVDVEVGPDGQTMIGDEVRFGFGPLVQAMLDCDGVVWHQVELSVLQGCKNVYSARFYELLNQYHGRRQPVIEMTVDDLYDYLCVPAGSSYRNNWSDFRRRVLHPVIELLNEESLFTVVGFDEERSGGRGRGGGRVIAVKIKVARKGRSVARIDAPKATPAKAAEWQAELRQHDDLMAYLYGDGDREA